MNDDCPGWELEAEDHRVLGQLSRLTKASSGRISSGEHLKLAMKLRMAQGEWQTHISELIHMSFVEENDGLLYLNIRCLCEQGEGLPRVGAKTRRTLQEGPIGGPGWSKLSPPRAVPRTRPRPSVRDAVTNTTLSVGEGSPLEVPVKATNLTTDALLSPDAKALQGFALPPRHVGGKQRAKSDTTTADLRRMFRQKYVGANLIGEATWILDEERSGEFSRGLRSMRDAGITPERIMAMMDAFMTMASNGEINLGGKAPWRVFLGKRKVLLDRVNRDSMLGDGVGEIRKAAVAQRRMLDALRDDG